MKRKTAARRKPKRKADRALLLADAERLENLDHARRVRAALHHPPRRHLEGRAIHAGVFGDLAEQSHAGDRRSAMARAGGRSRSSSPAPSCNISDARPGNSIRATSARASRSRSGCSGKSAGLGPMAGQAVHFRRYAPEQIPYAIARYTDEVNRLYGVMNTRLAEREFLAGRYSIADMACVGWVRLAERQGQDLARISPPVALVRSHPRARRRSSGPSPSASRRLPRSISNDPKVRAVLFGQRAR